MILLRVSVRNPDFDKRQIKEDKNQRLEIHAGGFREKTQNRLAGRGIKVAPKMLTAIILGFSVLKIGQVA